MSVSPIAYVGEIPDHVPSHLAFDVDFGDLIQGNEDAQLAWRRLQQELPDVFWTPRNGGHWIATRAADIFALQSDYERFSHRVHTLPRRVFEMPQMLTMDPPDHGPYRRLIGRAFMPQAVNSLEGKVREVAIETIERLIPHGRCEFTADFARVLPIVVFLDMVGLPQEDRGMLLDLVQQMHGNQIEAARRAIANYLTGWIDRRAESPGDDLISQVLQGTINGEPVSREAIIGTCSLLLVGGLDTVVAMLSFIANFLAVSPSHRGELVNNPELIPHAVEELIRRFGLTNTVRLVVGDTELGGAALRKGDVIQVPNALAGLDDRFVENPLTVDFHRKPIRHAAFGSGPHICAGAMLARREIQIFLQEWLKRIPNFEITPGTKARMRTGIVNGVTELYLSWPSAD